MVSESFLEVVALIAHIRSTKPQEQGVAEHCKNVAMLSAESGLPAGLENCCYLTGLLHDLGKCTRAFEKYIKSENRGGLYHSPQGAIFAYERWYLRDGASTVEKQTAQIISMVIRGHHGGLVDCLDPVSGESPYIFMLSQDKTPLFYDEAVENFLDCCASTEKLDLLFEASCRELEAYQIENKGMRKMLNTLYITTENSYLALDGENVVVLLGEEVLGRLPLHNLEGIVYFGYKGASPALMGKCAEGNISLMEVRYLC